MSFGKTSPAYEHQEPFLVIFWPTVRHIVCALLLLGLTVILSHLEILANLNSLVLGGVSGDGGLYLWLAQSVPEDLFSQPWFSTRAFYPYGSSLAWSDNFIVPSGIYWTLHHLGIPAIASYNLLLLGALLLNGCCTFLLAYLLTGALSASLFAGFVFQNLSFITFNTGHPQLLFAFFIPLSLALFFNLLSTPNLKRGALVGAAFSLCFLTTVYYALFAIVACATVVLAIILLRPGALRFRELCIIGGGTALGMIPLVPFLIPYLSVRDVFGARRLYESYYFSARGAAFLSAPPTSLLYGASAKLSHAEAHFFPGFVLPLVGLFASLRVLAPRPLRTLSGILVLAFLLTLTCTAILSPRSTCLSAAQAASFLTLGALGIFLIRLGTLERLLRVTYVTNRALIAIFISIFIVFSLMALGPLGNPEKGDQALSLFRILYELVPGFNSIRAVSRAGIVSLLSLCLLGAFGISQLQKRYTHMMPLFVSILGLIAFVENWQTVYPREAVVPPSTLSEQLAHQGDEHDALIVLPLNKEPLDPTGQPRERDFASTNILAMLNYKDSKKLLINGYSGQRSKLLRELPQQLRNFPDPRSLTTLGLIANLRYVIFDGSRLAASAREELLDKLHTHERDLRFIASDTDGFMLFELTTTVSLQDSYYVWIPRSSTGSLHLELMIPYESGEPLVPVTLLTDEGAPFASVNVTVGGAWQTFGLSLPAAVDSVRPLRIRFAVPEDRQIYLRNLRFYPDS